MAAVPGPESTMALLSHHLTHAQIAATSPEWFMRGWYPAVAGYLLGWDESCPHHPDPLKPQAVTAAAWRPGLYVCRRCVELLDVPDTPEGGYYCDACRTLCPPEGPPVKELARAVGEFLYIVGLCPRCYARDFPELCRPRPRGRRER